MLVSEQRTFSSSTGPGGKRHTFSTEQVDQALERVADSFNVPSLRPYQSAVAKAALVRCDTLAILPTGSGKSLGFWSIPVMYDFLFNPWDAYPDRSSREHIYQPFQLVISPLIGLMEEQVSIFNAAFPWLRAVHLSSSQSDPQVLQQMRDGHVNVLYCSPEFLLEDENSSWLKLLAGPLYIDRITSIVIDECHCVSKWAHDFRECYGQLFNLRTELSMCIPVVATTATLPPKVRAEVISSLGMHNYTTIELSCNRSNIFLARESYDSSEDGHLSLCKRLIEQLNFFGSSTPRLLVYTHTKEQARLMAMHIADNIGQHDGLTGVPLVNWYSADLTTEERQTILADFRLSDSKTRVLFSSNALGMGSDLQDLQAVWVVNPPTDIDDWGQMFGRVGRNGALSVATLFFDSSNIGRVSKDMRFFCTSNDLCLRALVVRYFSPYADPNEIREVHPSLSDSERAVRCCSVCSFRNTTHDPPSSSHNPQNTLQTFKSPTSRKRRKSKKNGSKSNKKPAW